VLLDGIISVCIYLECVMMLLLIFYGGKGMEESTQSMQLIGPLNSLKSDRVDVWGDILGIYAHICACMYIYPRIGVYKCV
jgi:hypothetical protein